MMSTLRSILFTKINLEYNCIEFYDFLKTQPGMLRQISSQDKYNFKQPKPVDSTSPGAMSIDAASDPDEE